MSILHTLTSVTTKSKKRLGRGYGSGKGSHTSSRGQKGQNSRNGSKIGHWFEGGQLPMVKRMPMIRGKARFNVIRPTARITLSELEKLGQEIVTLETLKLAKLIDSRYKKAKVVATGTLTKAVQLQGIKASAQAEALIKKAGGSVS